MMHRVDTFLGIGIMTAFVAYDTHVAIKSYQLGYADHYLVAMDLSLDIWNILVRMMEVLGLYSGSDGDSGDSGDCGGGGD